MNRSQSTAVLFTIVCSLLVVGCAKSEPVVEIPPIPGGLVFDAVMHRSDVEMFPTFADINLDSKPDLILGTFRNLTVHLNESADGELAFAAPDMPKRSHSDYDIPWG